jgi:AraC family transcriptional activator of mtrCDE
MTPVPIAPMSRADLDRLLLALEVESMDLRECSAMRGHRFRIDPADRLLLFYNRAGTGRWLRADAPPIEFVPHTLVISRPGREIEIEASPAASVTFVLARLRVSLGGVIDPFASLAGPIFAQFTPADQLDAQLTGALSEFLERQVGAEAMIGSLLKRILVTVTRHALATGDSWVECLSLLGDRRIGNVLNNMMATPGAPHSLRTLADASHMSRSAFVARFTSVVGHSPMAALRQLRMRRAAVLLTAGGRSIENVARHVGYASRSSFVRAFVDSFGTHPGDYRSGALRELDSRAPGFISRPPISGRRGSGSPSDPV